MSCRSRASRSEFITALKTKRDYPAGGSLMIRPEGQIEPILLQKRKGSNPGKEKLPAIKCPVCKKILFSVPNKQMRNAMLAYDLQNELLSSFCPSYIHRCPRCHNMVGILYLTRDIRKRLNITIAAAYLQLSDEQEQLNIGFD